MALNKNDIHSQVESHNVSCCDYRPKKSNPLLHQKEDWSKEVFCDTVPDFSVISEAASDYNSGKYSRSFRGISLKNIPFVINSKPMPPQQVPLSSYETTSDSETEHCEQYHETDVKHLIRPANRQAFQMNLFSPKQCDNTVKTNTKVKRNSNDSFFSKTTLVDQPKLNQHNVCLNAVHMPTENCSSEKSSTCEKCEHNIISTMNVNEVGQSAHIEDENVKSSTSAESNTGSLSKNKTHDPLPDNIRECLLEKDKQIKTMQIEISKLTEENKYMNEILKNVQENKLCNAENQCSSGRNPLSESNRDMNDLNQTLIRHLENRDRHMNKLQDQVDFLIRRTKELESYYLSNQKLVFSPRSNSPDNTYKENFPNTDTSFDFLNQNHAAKNKESLYQEQRQTQKTSTSTMTSLIFDGSDRMVFQKTTTLVTDYSNSKKDVSTQYTQNKIPIANTQIKSKNKYSPRNGDGPKLNKKCQRPNCKCKVQKESLKQYEKGIPYTNGATNFNAGDNIVRNSRRTRESPYDAEREKENIDEVELLSPPERPHFQRIAKNIQHHKSSPNENVDAESPLRRNNTKSCSKKPKSHKVRKSPFQNDASPNTIPKEISINQLDSEDENWAFHRVENNEHCNLQPTDTPNIKKINKKARRSHKKHQRSPFDSMPQDGRNSSMSSASVSSSIESLLASSPYQGNTEPEDFSPRKLDTASQFGITSPNLSQETVRYLAEYGFGKDRCFPSEGRTRLLSDRHDTRLPCDRHDTRIPYDRHDTRIPCDRHDTRIPYDRHDTRLPRDRMLR